MRQTNVYGDAANQSPLNIPDQLSLTSYMIILGYSHATALDDNEERVRINRVTNCAARDPHVVDIIYHSKCWSKYVHHYQN